MKKTTVVHLGNFKLFSLIRENLIIVIFTLIFAFGVLSSCWLYSAGHFLKETDFLLESLISVRASSSFFKIFFYSFLLSFIFLFLTYLFGTSLLGLAFIPCVLFFRGAISGLLLCGLYSGYSISGIAFNLLTIIPGTIIAVLALISASNCCLNLSYSLGKMVLNEGKALYKIDIKMFIKSFAVLLFVTIIASLLETLLSLSFQKFFIMG